MNATPAMAAAAPQMVAALLLVKAACGDANNWNGETRRFIEATDAALAAAGIVADAKAVAHA